MKHLLTVSMLLLGSIFFSGSIQAQCSTDVFIDNATSCDIKFKVAYTSSGPCGNATFSLTQVVLANSSVTYSPPGCADVKAVKFEHEGAGVWVSYACTPPQTSSGDIECNGNPVDINYTVIGLIELSD